MTNQAEEWRCQKCHTILLKHAILLHQGSIELEVKCPNKECRQLNSLAVVMVPRMITALIS